MNEKIKYLGTPTSIRLEKQGGPLPSRPPAPEEVREAALLLADRGWHPIELPAGADADPPPGRTGEEGVDMTLEEISAASWEGNIGLRMPEGVVGINIDKSCGGWSAFRSFIGEWEDEEDSSHLSRMPSSSRLWLPGGHYFARIPESWRSEDGTFPELPPNPCQGVEILQRHHRYAACRPSVIDGLRYKFYPPVTLKKTTAAAAARPPYIPAVSDLRDLPRSWHYPLVEGTPAIG